MIKRRLLVVDDEPVNLEIIREYLESEDYELTLVESAEAGLQQMEAGKDYELVILDRMMPGMNGIELLKRMKGDERFRHIPVIMQTAASDPSQVREGIQAGAFYYLAKPYEPATLLAIVRAALADVDDRAVAHRRAAAHVKAMELLDAAEFRLSRLEQVGPLIEVLASLCPVPDLAASGLTELLVNAIEHGNLGISYDEKKSLRLAGRWEEEVAQRLARPEFGDRSVQVRVSRRPGLLEFTVTDEGAGFDWQRYLDFDPERAADPNGRGIAMARLLSFARIEYQGRGNIVQAVVSTDQAAAYNSAP
jgi:CheY-like chemotaxis protein